MPTGKLTHNRAKPGQRKKPLPPVVNVIADIGNSVIKVMVITFDRKGEMYRDWYTFPHALRRLGGKSFDSIMLRSKRSLRSGQILDISQFSYNGISAMVGENAEAGMETRRTGGPKYQKDYYPFLFLHGLLRLIPDGHENIHVMALFPPGDIHHTPTLMDSLGGKHTVTLTNGDTVTYKVRKVLTLDEPVGGLSDYLLADDGLHYRVEHISDRLGLCIDIGGKISNIVPFRKDGFVDYDMARSVDIGVQDVMNNASDLLLSHDEYKKHFHAFRGDRLPHDLSMREALMNKTYEVAGFTLPVGEIVEEAVRPILTQIKEVYDNDMQGGRPYSYITITGGGGGLLYYELVSQVLNFNHERVYMTRPSVQEMYLSNIMGASKVMVAMKAREAMG